MRFTILLSLGCAVLACFCMPETAHMRMAPAIRQSIEALRMVPGQGMTMEGRPRCSVRTDVIELGGSFSGVFYPDRDSEGEIGKLNITGNDFELVVPSGNRRGTIVASKTCGYTALALRFAEGNTYGQTVSLTAHKIGSRTGFGIESLDADRPIVLRTAANESMDFAFVICPDHYPECWPYRRRCPCERP